MPQVGAVLDGLIDRVAVECPCGGDQSAPSHESSLLHRKWLWTMKQDSA
jgi:hypothetical protein